MRLLLVCLSVTAFFLSSSFVFADPVPAYVFQIPEIAESSQPRLHDLVREAASITHPEPEEARLLFIQALQEVSKGAEIDKYDYLWTQYGLLKSSFYTGSADFISDEYREDYKKIARTVLDYLNTQDVGSWVYTEIGAFQMEVYREAGNGLAWYKMEDGELKEALDIISQTKSNIRGPEDYYIYDTEVRILLKMEKIDDAYRIVQKILSEEPFFGDFQDIKNSEAYNNWLEKK